MKRPTILLACAVVSLVLPSLGRSQYGDRQSPPPPGGPRPSPDSLAALNDSLMNDVLRAIAGRETAPAESVFKDIKVLKGVPAGRVPRIMSMGFSRSLGVSCFACHTDDKKWEADGKAEKETARLMWKMSKAINDNWLTQSKELEGASVNCFTCHRGHRDPGADMKRGPGGPARPGGGGERH